jgi:hypothetical protein
MTTVASGNRRPGGVGLQLEARIPGINPFSAWSTNGPTLPPAAGRAKVVFMSRNIVSWGRKRLRDDALGAQNLSPDGKWICIAGVDRASNRGVADPRWRDAADVGW